jgi:hypothetical protein
VGNCGSAAVRAVVGEKGWGSLASKMRVGRLPDQSGCPTPVNKPTFWKGSPMNTSPSPCNAQPVTQEQLDDLALKISIALHALADGLEIVAIQPGSLETFMFEIKTKIEAINLNR